MTPTDKCPSPQAIQELVNGTLSDAETDSLEQHLLDCEPCSKSAETLFPVNEITAVFTKKPKPEQAPEDVAAISRLVNEAKKLKPEASESSDEQTQAWAGSDEAVQEKTFIASADSANPSGDQVEFLLPAQEPDEIGRLGDYRILQVLGSGGMGVVFRAEDPQLKRSVALKAMKPVIAANSEAKARFLREAQATAAIEHDNIVHIYQVGEDQNVPFIAMQFLQGESLQQRIDREGQLDETEVLRVGREIAQGLAAAHAQGLTHRDIKPDNIWLQEEQGRVKIVDFGLVRDNADDAGLTQTGVIMGTPRYMAPEQARGEQVDHRCDLFSLGSLLYQLASGKPAFQGNNLTATLIAVAHETPQTINEHNPDLDPAVATLIMRLLEKAPDRRPQTAQEVVETISQIETEYLQPPDRPALTAAASAAPTVMLPGSRSSKGLRRGIGGFGLTILLGVLIFKFATRDGTVVVELDGTPEIATVEIDDNEVSFSPGGTDKQLTFKVDPGNHKLSIKTEGGLELITDLGKKPLEIKAGDTTRLRAWLEPPSGETKKRDSITLSGTASVPVPPSLNDWLKGRRIITVSQDGTSDFTTIGEALVSMRHGEVIEIMDKGPYLEPLEILSPPTDTGLISRCGTVISPKGYLDFEDNIHHLDLKVRLSSCVGFRLSGLEFRVRHEKIDHLIHAWSSADVVVEGCRFIANNVMWKDEKRAPILLWLPPPVVGRPAICLRNNYFQDVSVWINLQASGSKLLITQNLFLNNLTKQTVEIRGTGDARTTSVIRENVFAALSIPAQGLSVTCEWTNPSQQSMFIEHNTFFVPRGASVVFRHNVLTSGVTYQYNNSQSLSGIYLLPQAVSATREQSLQFHEQWNVHHNYYASMPGPRYIPVGPTDVVGGVDLLSKDLDDPTHFMRIAQDISSVIAGGSEDITEHIGALPPGPAPREGDWLTHLLRSAAVSRHVWELPAAAPAPAIAPFTAEQAEKYQEEWADYLGVPVEREIDLGNDTVLTLVLTPPGEFQMGSTADEQLRFLKDARPPNKHTKYTIGRIPSEGPQHQVRITWPFYLGKFEVTQAQWQAVLGTNPSQFNDNTSHPVEAVSWNDVQSFLVKLNESASTDNMTYVFPTEAQWEYACRAGTTTPYYGGKANVLEYAWCVTNSDGMTHPVGGLKRNAFGLFDMDGNVWEWCADWSGPGYYADIAINDPTGPTAGTQRVYRGGGWRDPVDRCRSAFRNASWPIRNDFIGFRLAAKIDGKKSKAKAEWELPADAPLPAIAPFTADQARKHQEEWAKYLGAEVETTNSIGMKFQAIPPGEFLMGTGSEEFSEVFEDARKLGLPNLYVQWLSSETPQQKVVLAKPFAFSAHEVSREQFQQFVQSTGYQTEAEKDGTGGLGWKDGKRVKSPEFFWNSKLGFESEQTDQHPVVNVSWNDAVAFCDWLSRKEGVPYRLPTEAEWEFACRAGNYGKFCFGNDVTKFEEYGWNVGRDPKPITQKQPNSFGLFDMHGNVWEWCYDKHGPYSISAVIDPIGPSDGFKRVMRGGSVLDKTIWSRSAYRYAKDPIDRCNNVGFRVAAPLDLPSKADSPVTPVDLRD
jgi:formylglycine-generating enzyme required for sulfatase activity/serine/threonine protein kinase